MSKRQRNQAFKGTPNELEGNVTPGELISDEPKPRAFQPRACTNCTALREPNSNYSKVTCTKRESGTTIRYCKCRFCGNTWTQEASA